MKYIKMILKYSAIFVAFSISISIVLIWWFSPFAPFLDDGPFYGRETNLSGKGDLKQDYPIHNGMRLKVYNNTIKNEPPIVQLITREGSIKWSILPTGSKKTTVSDIKFTNYSCSFILLACNVSGYVTWTFGRERMNWHIYKWGGLRAYYYSW